MSKRLSALRTWLESSPVRMSLALGMLVIAIGMAKYGISMWAGWRNLYEVALSPADPFRSDLRQPPQDYILLNATPSIFLGLAGISEQTVYVSVQVIGSVFALLLPFLMPTSLRNPRQAKLLFLFLVGGPLLPLLLTWIGGYDALVVAGLVLAVLAKRRSVICVGWMIASIGHTSLALLAAILWLVFTLVTSSHRSLFRHVASQWPVALGLTIGFIWTLKVEEIYGGVTSRLEVYLLYPVDYYVQSFLAGLPLLLFSAMGIGWVILLDRDVRQTRPAITALVLVALSSVVIPIFALDQSRVIAVVTLPILLGWIRLFSESSDEAAVGNLFHRYGVVASLVPVVLVGGGEWLQTGWQRLLYWRATFL